MLSWAFAASLGCVGSVSAGWPSFFFTFCLIFSVAEQNWLETSLFSFLSFLLRLQFDMGDFEGGQRFEWFSFGFGRVFEHFGWKAVENRLKLIVLFDGKIDWVLTDEIGVVFGWDGFSWAGKVVGYGWEIFFRRLDVERGWSHEAGGSKMSEIK